MSKPTVRRYLKLLAPGTPLRAGVDRILQGRFAGARGIGSGKPPAARKAEVEE